MIKYKGIQTSYSPTKEGLQTRNVMIEDTNIEKVYRISDDKIEDVELNFKRYLYQDIDWDSRLVCLKGPRGVGKTTILLQHIKECFEPGQALYVSLDNIWINVREVYELAEHHLAHGGTHLFLDEVHKAGDWQNLIKSLNDDLKRLHVVYTGSSLLKIEKQGGDLSRRQIQYFLPGLSFREYLKFEGIADFKPLRLEDLLRGHIQFARKVRGKFPVLKHFNAYLEHGYYPFYKDNPRHFPSQVMQVVNQVLDVDYPEIEDVEVATISKARRMLSVLAASCPQTPNMAKLYAQLETDRKNGLKILYALERAGLLALLSSQRRETLKSMSTPDKILCDNTNLLSALASDTNKGSIRETFFMNAVRHSSHKLSYPEQGDFLVDGKYLFEVGGKGKGFDQIKDVQNSFVAQDDVEVGFGNKIPLWLFGFLY